MHKNYEKQRSFMEPAPVHPKAKEFEIIDQILDENPNIYNSAFQDLTKGTKQSKGAKGMSAEQVVRAALIKHIEQCSYSELSFHIADSRTYRNFCKIGFGDKTFKKSALQKNIKALSAETWKEIHNIVLSYAQDNKIEDGHKVRIDCTVVESNIHAPYDSELLWDSVRVLNRLLSRAKENLAGIDFPYRNHTRRAKRRALNVTYAKNAKARNDAYKDLLKVTKKVISYSDSAIPEIKSYPAVDAQQMVIAVDLLEKLEHYLPLTLKVVDQTERRINHGETVPAAEKVVSIFEEHTDIIRKDRRDTYYGHKICLTGGASNLILDCLILDGNPADSTLTEEMFNRLNEIYNRYPKKAALDGGFASQLNLEKAKSNGIKDVCFAKGKGLEIEDMCKSNYVFKKLRKFRAGIESGISWLKRSFGLTKCLWKGLDSFKSYVWSSIVSANLLTIARKQMS
ncbi:MAG: ISNCY family transposase [candidate division Zixibacteria bacterium]|nr:ISNCY family transposase [candidate division Zixibacteria bacterium]